ncbi:hypothetical protein Gotur_023878, partial [Gossypium turneri]
SKYRFLRHILKKLKILILSVCLSSVTFPITKKCIMPESNEIVAGIEISFKEKDIKYMEFLFSYYMDDSIRKDHDWELFDRLSPSKR